MSNNELIEKVITTSTVAAGSGGLLNPEQSNEFLDYMFDATVLVRQVHTERMKAPVMDIDKIGIGKRIVRPATEAVDTGQNVGATFTKVSLTTRKLRVDWELSRETLEDNIAGDNLDTQIARDIGTQAGNDLEDLAINGDTTSADPTLVSFDGWRKLLLAGAHVITGTTGVDRAVFNKALKAMPRNFMQRRSDLRFYTSSGLIQDYAFSFQTVESGFVQMPIMSQAMLNQPVRTEGPAGYTVLNAFGVPVQEVPLFADYDLDGAGGGTVFGSDIWLTNPKNLLYGIKRDVEVFREFKPKKDSVEYTMYTRVGVQVEELDAAVVTKNVSDAT